MGAEEQPGALPPVAAGGAQEGLSGSAGTEAAVAEEAASEGAAGSGGSRRVDYACYQGGLWPRTRTVQSAISAPSHGDAAAHLRGLGQVAVIGWPRTRVAPRASTALSADARIAVHS